MQPLVSEVILFARPRSEAAELRRRRFYLVIDLQGLLRTGLMCLVTGANRIVEVDPINPKVRTELGIRGLNQPQGMSNY